VCSDDASSVKAMPTSEAMLQNCKLQVAGVGNLSSNALGL